MDSFDVWGENGNAADAGAPAPTPASPVKWEEDLTPRGGGDLIGHAVFRGTMDGDGVKCRGWIEIYGDNGGSLVVQGRLKLIGNTVGQGRLRVIAISSESSWDQVEVSIENPKRYTAV
jgi:hypothetical protein